MFTSAGNAYGIAVFEGTNADASLTLIDVVFISGIVPLAYNLICWTGALILDWEGGQKRGNFSVQLTPASAVVAVVQLLFVNA